MTTTVVRDVRRTYHSLPPNLPESITTLHAEQTALIARLRPTLAHLDDLADEKHDDAAREADAQLAAVAVRDGKPAATAGTPNAAQLSGDRKAALSEADALIAASGQLDHELGVAFGKLISTSKTSGIPEAEAAIAKYRKSAEALIANREAAFTAINATAYKHLAAPSETWPEDASGTLVRVPAWIDVAMRRMNTGPELRWNPATPPVQINTISGVGERDYNLRAVSAAHLIAETFGSEFNTETEK